MGVGMFKAPACLVGAGASKNVGEAANFCEFLKKCAINKFLALVKKVNFSAFLNFSENCPTLLGCGVQTT